MTDIAEARMSANMTLWYEANKAMADDFRDHILRSLCDGEAMERAAKAAFEYDTANLLWAETFETTKNQWRGIVEAAAPLIRAPLVKEVEKLTGELEEAEDTIDNFRAVHAQDLTALSTAEARVQRLEAALKDCMNQTPGWWVRARALLPEETTNE